MCTTQVWTVASGQMARIDSGRPPITVAAHDQRVGQAAVAQLGQHRGPLLGALAAGGAQPQVPHVAFAGEIHADRHVHGPVGYLGVKGLDHDGVEPSTGQTASSGAVLPRRHVGHHRVGDLRDRLPAHADAVDLGQVRPDLAGREPFRVQRDHVARQALETAAVLAVPSPGRMSPHDHAAPPARPRRSRSSPSWASSRYASSATRDPQQHDAHSPDAPSSRPRDRSGAPGAPAPSTHRPGRSAPRPRHGPGRPTAQPSPSSPPRRQPRSPATPAESDQSQT